MKFRLLVLLVAMVLLTHSASVKATLIPIQQRVEQIALLLGQSLTKILQSKRVLHALRKKQILRVVSKTLKERRHDRKA